MKIVIVGGGTAGWLAALMTSSIFKNVHEVTLISSSEHPVIGVGESSTGFLRGVVNNEVYDYGCNEFEFMKMAEATPKLGILYKNWKNNLDYFEPLESFAPPSHIDSDALLTAYVAMGIDPSLSSLSGRMFHQNLSGFVNDNKTIRSYSLHAYNFDSGLAGQYFKKISISNGVKYLDVKIKDIVVDSSGIIKYLTTDGNQHIEGDFFIDASGFNKLFSKKLGISFINDENFLVNSALIFNSPDTEKLPATTSTARDYGWSWTIPKINSNGTGYVYSDHFINEFEAEKEIINAYGENTNIIRNIKFSSGSLEKFWHKNCLFIGIGSQFFEPLEATSIHGTIAQLNIFLFNFLEKTLDQTVNDYSIDLYNKSLNNLIDNFKNFILVHYLTDKTNTDFWIEMNKIAMNNSYIKSIYEISKTRCLNLLDSDYYCYGAASIETYNQIFALTGHFSKNSAIEKMSRSYNKIYAKQLETTLCNELSQWHWIKNNELISYIRNGNLYE